jgi:thiamine biosynthesis lipoprotein
MVNAAFEEVERVEQLMSEWRPSSAISAVNLAAGKAPVQVPLEVVSLMQRALSVARATDGAFDPTWAALRGVWDFKTDPPRLPLKSTLRAAVARIDHRKVQIDNDTVYLPEAGMALGLGGIAKGYGIDRAVAILRARGLTRFIVDGGGDLYIAGEKEPGVPWTIGLRHPRGGPLVGELPVRDAAVVTSGDYERFFELGGTRYHHIIDVRTGMPAQKSVAVSLIAPDATTADAWATGLFVLGPAGLDRLPAGVSAAVFTSDGRSHARGILTRIGPRWR